MRAHVHTVSYLHDLGKEGKVKEIAVADDGGLSFSSITDMFWIGQGNP
jgi:hypothetical protein